MTVKQISVFLENTAGRLAEVTALLGEKGVNLRAATIADTADFGILRIIADDPGRALQVLKEGGFTAKETDVYAIEIEDQPGGLAKVMELFEENRINIEYLYATLEKKQNNAVVIFRVDDLEKARRIIEKNGLKTLEGF